MTLSRKLMLAVALAGAGTAAWWHGGWSEILPGFATASKAPVRAVPPPTMILSKAATAEKFVINKRTIGMVEPIEQVTIKARVDSQIAQQNVRDGAMVAAGDLLFTLDDRELKAQVDRDEAQIERDRATLARAQADLKRKEDLVQKGAGTPQAYDQAVADEAVARATLASDEATLALDRTRLGYTIIKSPISGRAGSIAVTQGNLVKANDTGPGLVTITQIKPIRVALQMSERELPKLQALFAAGTPPLVTARVGGTSTVLATGHASFLDSAVDVTSGTVTVKADFDNDIVNLWPGMFVDVDVALETIQTATVIPTVAAQTGQRGSYVFVVKPDDTVEMRPISVTATDGQRLAVKAGLAAGERVVVEGQGRLVNGAKVKDGSQANTTPTARSSSIGRVSDKDS